MSQNPYSVTVGEPHGAGVYGDAKRVRGGFLYRVIDIPVPVSPSQSSVPQKASLSEPLRLRYTGWWFVQRLYVNRTRVWWKISWLKIDRHIQFCIPVAALSESADRGGIGERSAERTGEIDISFGPSLFIGRFQVWIDGQLVYDEMS